jgi:hypothetical protein
MSYNHKRQLPSYDRPPPELIKKENYNGIVEYFQRPSQLSDYTTTASTFNSVNGYVPALEPGESYEDHIKHLNISNRFYYG